MSTYTLTPTYARGQGVNVTVAPPSGSTQVLFNSGALPSYISATTNGTTGVLTLNGTASDLAGTYTFFLVDNTGTVTWTVNFTITDPSALSAPVISVAGTTVVSGVNTLTVQAGSISIPVFATNQGTNWSCGGLPYSLNGQGSGEVGYTYIQGTAGVGTSMVTLYCNNYAYSGGPAQTASYTFQLIIVPAAPVVSASDNYGSNFNHVIGDALNITCAVQQYASPVTWAATGLPSGVVINPSSGVITGALTATGTSSVVITATNATGSGSLTIDLVVLPIQSVPVVTLSATQVGAQTNGSPLSFATGAPCSVYFTATNAPTSWAASNLPAGLAINTSTGVVSGRIIAPGSYQFTVTATNGVGASVPLSVVIEATGTAQAFEFISADATLQDIQIDSRTGAVTSSNLLALKQNQQAKFALVFTDLGAPVAPPDASSLQFGVRPFGKFEEGYLFDAVTPTLVAASGSDPAYLLYAFEVDSDELDAQLNALITPPAIPASSSATATLPVLNCMADIVWLVSSVARASQTFTLTVAPAVTD